MQKTLYCSGLVLVAILIATCAREANSPQGFRLPSGNAEAGKMAFTTVGCIQCHTIKGESLPEPNAPREINVPLGGDVSQVKTYAQLVTSIIYPSHIIKNKYKDAYRDEQGNSVMTDFTENMTVRQMIDIAQYLQTHYNVVMPTYPNPVFY
ncbi:hypothetical protein VDG1235_865 [Verrucomicrobiia bacterium DG1235]|nr:hypothetical protein VDG1235_865 [Verrucomicrobiae bacterium DG1235]